MKTMLEIPVLKDEVNTMIPMESMEDFELLFHLALQYKYNPLSIEELRTVIYQYFIGGWKVKENKTGIFGGVIYFTNVKGLGYTFDAYKDNELVKGLNRRELLDVSVRTGQLALDFYDKNIGDTLYCSVVVQNKGAVVACQLLGFHVISVYDSIYGEHVLMVRKKGE